MSRVMIVAGEASGDKHGALFVRAVREIDGGVEFFGAGGPAMQQAGVELFFDLDDMSLMGLAEIVAGLAGAWRALRTLKRVMAQRRPHGLVLIDYPDFNFLLAKEARRLGVPVFYYVCPQIWAWRQGRVKKMADRVDRRVVIFPFEVDFYRRRGLTADYVGHPLLDEMDPPLPRPEARELAGLDRERPLVLLMPGSRRKVIARNWPVMSGVVRRLARQRPDLDFAAARAPNVPLDYLTEVLGPDADLVRIETGSRLLQNAADAALVSSGTATLETALMETPMAVTYRAHPITVMAARRLISIDYASIVNLIAGREVVPEFLQENARPDRMAAEMEELLEPGLRRREMIAGMREVRDLLGGPGASRRAAELLLETIGAP